MRFLRYVYTRPDALPLDEENPPAVGGEDFVAACEAAGFDPDDEEITACRLAAAWNGHPAGAVVITGLTVEGHPFAVEVL